LPKIEVGALDDAAARGVLVAMLRSAADLAVGDAGATRLGLQRMHLLDVFILDFCRRVARLLRGGAIRNYQAFDDDLAALRGRIRLAEQVRRTAAERTQLRCGFDELSPDNAHNQALKAVLARLLPQAMGPDARAAVSGLLHRLAEISDVPCTAPDIERLPFTRLTNAWKPMFERAGWFLRGLYPDVRAGGVEGLCLLFDMQRLFEAFVGARLRREWRSNGTGSRVVLQGPRQYLADSTKGPAFRLRPDAAVVSTAGAVEQMFDAKWKRLDAGAVARGVAREDAYQLAAYAGTYRCPNVVLVYPRPPGLPAGLIESFELRLPFSARIQIYALDIVAALGGPGLPIGLTPFRFRGEHLAC
jgi:5-methylcytosine-specific restriction enzyme subunit McrC